MRSKLVRLKVLLCAHVCGNRSMHGIVLGGLDGYIIDFMLSLKRVLWLATESVGVIIRYNDEAKYDGHE